LELHGTSLGWRVWRGVRVSGEASPPSGINKHKQTHGNASESEHSDGNMCIHLRSCMDPLRARNPAEDGRRRPSNRYSPKHP
jgi:hypothetical protein